MYKLAVVFVFAALLGFTSTSLVIPPACTAEAGGGGNSVSIYTYVTNLTLAATELAEIQPYNLTAGTTYNVTFAFIPTSDTQVQVFKVIAEFIVNGVPQQMEIASTNVGPYEATTVTTVLSYTPALLDLQLILACAVPNILDLTLLELLNCGDSLAYQALSYVPSQASATVIMTVPEDAMDTAIFRGIVGDNNGNVVACRQGNVTILGN